MRERGAGLAASRRSAETWNALPAWPTLDGGRACAVLASAGPRTHGGWFAMRDGIGRRAFVARLVGSAAALGFGALARPRAAAVARAQPAESAPIPVRLGELAQAGADFRGGLAEGVRLPVAGGDTWALAAERAGGRFTSEPLPIEFACTHVGVHWQADGGRGGGSGFRVELRSSRDGQRWSAWRPVRVESHRPERADRPGAGVGETFGALVAGRRGRWLQYRLTFEEAGPAAAAVRRVGLTYLDAGDTVPARGGAESRASSLVLGGQAGPPGSKGAKDAFLARVVTREGWGADESIRFEDGRDRWPRAFVAPKLLVVHHTATDNETVDPAAEVRAIYTYHAITQGFGDIGYNLLVDDRGQAYEGRRGREADASAQPGREVLSPDVVAGHALGYNYGSVGIALLGTFTDAEPGEAALGTLEEALAFFAARHGLDPTERTPFLRAWERGGEDMLWRDDLAVILGHRDCVPTECPGDRLYARLPELRDRAAARLGPTGPRARIARAPEDRSPWPTDLVFGWEGLGGAAEFSTRLEGWRPSDEPGRIVPLSGYGREERAAWSAWSRERGASFPLPPDARGSYTLHVRARDPGGREGLYDARWPLFVDRHALADNADGGRTARHGTWRRSSNVLGFNGADYEVAGPTGDPASFEWVLEAPEDGTYRVLACWTEGSDRASNARFAVSASGRQLAAAEVSQRENGGRWVELARVPLSAGTPCRVELTNRADGVVVADVIRIVLT